MPVPFRNNASHTHFHRAERTQGTSMESAGPGVQARILDRGPGPPARPPAQPRDWSVLLPVRGLVSN